QQNKVDLREIPVPHPLPKTPASRPQIARKGPSPFPHIQSPRQEKRKQLYRWASPCRSSVSLSLLGLSPRESIFDLIRCQILLGNPCLFSPPLPPIFPSRS